MAARDYDAAPVSERLDLDNVIKGLCSDLELLRAGKIGVSDAIARSLLAKQIFMRRSPRSGMAEKSPLPLQIVRDQHD